MLRERQRRADPRRTGAATPATTPAEAGAAPAAAAPPPSGSGAFAGRTGQLVNPDESTMVFLYYDLAGIQPPIDRWVEDDNRVRMAPAIDKAATRATVRAELEAGPGRGARRRRHPGHHGRQSQRVRSDLQ